MNHQTKKIKSFLEKFGVKSEIKEFLETTKTAADAAKALNCDLGQIAKSIVFRGVFSGKPVLVIASGRNRINEKIVATYLEEEIEKADADFVREKTGFAIGGIPPFGHKEKIKTFIDEDLLKYPLIWAAAGTHNTVFSLSQKELTETTQGEVVTVV